MGDKPRRYRYVGPPEIRISAASQSRGTPIRSAADIDQWAAGRAGEEFAEPFTYVIDLSGSILLAPRRSEHVACAGGRDVLAAGEMAFERAGDGWSVTHVSNQSTGYCPDVTSWAAVATALDRAGLRRPDCFTFGFVFRRCTNCGELNIVKDDDYVCQMCGTELSTRWNLASDQAGVETNYRG